MYNKKTRKGIGVRKLDKRGSRFLQYDLGWNLTVMISYYKAYGEEEGIQVKV